MSKLMKLQTANVALSHEVQTLRAGIDEFLAHIATAQVAGTDRAWMSTRDIYARLNLIKTDAFEAFHTACGA